MDLSHVSCSPLEVWTHLGSPAERRETKVFPNSGPLKGSTWNGTGGTFSVGPQTGPGICSYDVFCTIIQLMFNNFHRCTSSNAERFSDSHPGNARNKTPIVESELLHGLLIGSLSAPR